MTPRTVASLMGAFLIVAGTGLIIAQMFVGGIELPFLSLVANVVQSVQAQTNVVGLGVIIAGVLLVAISMIGGGQVRSKRK